MSSGVVRMVADDPSKIHLLTEDMQKQVSKAATATVNMEAAIARRKAVENEKREFITRNTWTERQIQYTKMPEGFHSIGDIQASVGATEQADYMKLQEEGGIRRPKRGRTLAIPTNIARGGRKRNLVQRSMYLKNLTRDRRVREPERSDYAFWFYSKKAQRVAMAYVAWKKQLLIDTGGTGDQRNLFRVTRFIKKGRKGVAFRLKEVYRFDKPAVTIPKTPWLAPASEAAAAQAAAIFAKQMEKLGL